MLTRRLAVVFFAFISIYAQALADTLFFVAQWDPALGATNYSWFNSNNWWASDGAGGLVPAGRVPASSEEAVITGYADAFASAVRVRVMTLTNSAVAANGTFSIERFEMHSGSIVKDARVNVLTWLRVGGTNCSVEGTTLYLLSTASGAFSPASPAAAATLCLDRGSMLLVAGRLNLAGGSEIDTLGEPQNMIAIPYGGMLASVGASRIRGSGSNPLIIDNSGLIQSNGGTLTFEEGIEWRSTAGVGEFRAANSNAVLLFSSIMRVPTAVVSLFTGPGMSRFQEGAVVEGEARVGSVDSASQSFTAGNLVIDDSVSGSGALHVLGSPAGGSVLTWNNGTMSLSAVNIEAGGNLEFAGGSGTTRVLSGCAVINRGLCALLSPDVAMVQSGSIQNETEGVFEILVDGTFSGGPLPDGGAFENKGLFRKTTTGVTSFGRLGEGPGPDFHNVGIVDVQSGGLNLCGGSSAGEFRTGAAGSLWFWGGTHVLNSGSIFSGLGPVHLAQGQSPPTWRVTGGITVERLELGSNGTVSGFGKIPSTPIRIGRLVASANGALTNGGFGVGQMEMQHQAVLADSVLTASNTLAILGTNCGLSGSVLTIPASAKGQVSSDADGNPARLELRQGASIEISGQLKLSDGALIAGGGTPQDRLMIRPGGTLVATNAATVRGSAAGPLAIDNVGIVRVEGGTLAFEDGIEWQSSGGLAQFDAAAQSLLLFASPLRLPAWATCIFTGAGTNRLAAGGAISGVTQVGMNAPSSPTLIPGNLEIDSDLGGSTLDILGSPAVGGSLIWNNGTLSIASLNVDPGARVVVAGDSSAAHQLLGCVINNAGLVTWTGTPVNAGAGAAINVLTGGALDFQSGATVLFNGAGPRLAIRNSGSLIKSAGTGSTTIAADVVNSGQFDIRSGPLEVQGALAQNLGSTVVQAGTVLKAPSFVVSGGTLSGAGVVDAVLDNGGTVAPGLSLGTLSLSAGRDFHQGPGGVLEIEVGGGVPGIDADQLLVGGTARLGGVLDVRLVNGLVPQAGQSFTILTGASLLQTFSTITGSLPSGTTWVPRYNATNVTITLAEKLALASSSSAAGFGLSFSTTAGLVYVIQATESLEQPNWQTVASVSGDGSSKSLAYPVDGPRRFYRIQLQ